MKRSALFLSSLLITVTAGADSTTPQSLSPQDAAAAFSIGRFIEQEAPNQSGLLIGFADLYKRDIKRIAATLGGTRRDFQPTLVPCEFGGEVELSGTAGFFYILHADYRDCATRITGLETTRTGAVEVVLFNLPLLPQRLISVRFGNSGVDFVEQRQFVQAPPDSPPTRESLNYTVVGDFFEHDDQGSPVTGDYNVIVNGTFAEEQHFLNAGNELLLSTSLIDADKLHVSGGVRLVSRDIEGEQSTLVVTTTKYDSGVLTLDIFEEKSEPEFVRKKWAFDEFKLVVAADPSTDAVWHSIGGKVLVNRPETATPNCVSGLLAFATPIRVAETGRESQEFTAGLVRINDATIRFTGGNPGVFITAPGHESVELDSGSSLFAFGNCSY